MTSTDSTVRSKCDDLVNVYYTSFSTLFNNVNMNAKDVYSKEEFLNDLKICAPSAFIVANTAIWLSSGMQQEGHVRSRIVCNSEEDKIVAANTYKSRITSVLDDFFAIGYFS